MARSLANACAIGDRKVTFFMRKGADVLSKWVGESEKQLRMLFEVCAASQKLGPAVSRKMPVGDLHLGPPTRIWGPLNDLVCIKYVVNKLCIDSDKIWVCEHRPTFEET